MESPFGRVESASHNSFAFIPQEHSGKDPLLDGHSDAAIATNVPLSIIKVKVSNRIAEYAEAYKIFNYL